MQLTNLVDDHCRLLGPDHPNTLTTRHELAYWRVAAGDARGGVEELGALVAQPDSQVAAGVGEVLAANAIWRRRISRKVG